MGLGRRALAQLAGVSPTTVAAIESGMLGHTASVAKLAAGLGVKLRLVAPGASKLFWTGTAASSVHHGWTTPTSVLDALYGVVGGVFGLDPCSPAKGSAAPVKARIRFTVENDGLSLPWRAASVFVNPPYGRETAFWVAKAREEQASSRAGLVIALVPARPDTRWWHDHVARKADIWMLKGRLAFGDGANPAPFPSALVGWGADDGHVARMSAAFPTAWHIPP